MLNKAQLIGNVGKNRPEVKTLQDGKKLANFSVATTEKFKDKNGEWKEHTEWHNVTVNGKTAEYAEKNLEPGTTVYIEGRLRTRKWQDRDGKDRYSTGINADVLRIVAKKRPANSAGNEAPPPAEGDEPYYGQDDDIPF